MSFFEDEFYTTKVSMREKMGRSLTSVKRKSSVTLSTVIALTSVLSISLTVLAVTMFSGDGKVTPDQGALNATDMVANGGNDRIIQAAAKVNAAVVSVLNMQTSDSEDSDVAGEEGTALGSGVIFFMEGKKARIITNSHVVANSTELQVVLSDGTEKTAKLLGQDDISDLAVLEIDSTGVNAVAELGDSDKLQIGEWVIAIGNPLGLGFSQTITFGIVSSTNRLIPISLGNDGNYDWEQKVIQTDAAINQGNSGGALVNLHGQVIGINSMKVADMGVEGLGFAIPMNDVLPIVKELIEKGKIDRPYFGVSTVDLQNYVLDSEPLEGEEEQDSVTDVLKLPADVKTGIIVLESLGPALEAGIDFNDVIVKLDDKEINSEFDLRKYLYTERVIGDKVKVTFYREGKLKTVEVVLAAREE